MFAYGIGFSAYFLREEDREGERAKEESASH
jgi:hypothetical protein